MGELEVNRRALDFLSKLQGNTRTWLSLLLLLGLALLFLWRVPLRGDILLSADMLLDYEPWRSELEATPIWNERTADPLRDIYPVALYLRDTWRQGQIPFWYPYVGLGLPVLARGMNQVLYPINYLLWQFMDVPESFGWSTILHLFLASCFTFLYLRELKTGHFGSLIAAITFAYSSIPVMWLGLPFFFDTMIWLPLIFLGFERALNRQDWRWTLLGVLALALQILAGSPQLVSYGLLALMLYAAGRSFMLWRQQSRLRQSFYPLALAGIIVGGGLSLVAFQIFATAELIMSGVVRAGVTIDIQPPAWTLLRLLLPDIFGTPVDGYVLSTLEFESYLYLGLLPLFFMGAALFSVKATLARLWFGIGLLFLLVIYSVPPFFQLFYYLYPAFPSLGFHRSLYVIIFLWAATAGLGADYLLHSRPRALLAYLLSGGLLIGLVVLAITLRLAFIAKYQARRHVWPLPELPEFTPDVSYYFATLVIFLAFIGLSLTLLWLWRADKLSNSLFAGAALTLLVADLFLTHLDYTPVLPRNRLTVSPPSLTHLQALVRENPALVRISGVGKVLRPDTGGSYRLPSIQVHDSYMSKRLSDYADLVKLRSEGNFRDISFEPATNRLLDALNVRYIYAHRADLKQGDWISVLNDLGGLSQVISNHAEAGQVADWTIDHWTQPVLLAPSNSRLIYQGRIPRSVVLETALAVDPQAGLEAGITFEIYVLPAGQETGTPLFSHRLEPGMAAVQAWHPVAIDLSPFGGQMASIVLVTVSEAGHKVAGGWADPLITDSSKYELAYYGVNSIYQNKKGLPRAWIVHRVTAASSIEQVKARLSAPDFDPGVEAVIEGALNAPVTPPSTASPPPRFITYSDSYIKLAAHLAAPGFLVLSDLYYPGWQAYIDGVRRPLYATNLAMRGVYVPVGNHQIEFRYEPLAFRIGLALSLTSLILIITVVSLDWRRRRRRGSVPTDQIS